MITKIGTCTLVHTYMWYYFFVLFGIFVYILVFYELFFKKLINNFVFFKLFGTFRVLLYFFLYFFVLFVLFQIFSNFSNIKSILNIRWLKKIFKHFLNFSDTPGNTPPGITPPMNEYVYDDETTMDTLPIKSK